MSCAVQLSSGAAQSFHGLESLRDDEMVNMRVHGSQATVRRQPIFSAAAEP